MLGWTVVAMLLVLTAAACDDRTAQQLRRAASPDASTVEPLPALSADDHQVIAAVIAQRLAPRVQPGSAPSDPPPVVVLSDVTLSRLCTVKNREVPLHECVPQLVDGYLQRHPEWGTNAARVFWSRNAEARQITSALGDRAAVVSLAEFRNPKDARRFRKWNFLQQYPRGSEFYQVSTPAYPSAKEAVLFYHSLNRGGSAIHLVRADSGWLVKGSDGWTE